MTKKAEWWRGDHPDAAEHRKHLERAAKEKAERALAIIPVRKALPPSRPRKNQSMLMTKDFENIGAVMGKTIMPMIKRLEDRVRELEARPALIWRGTWRNGESYALNDLVQDKGTVFVAVALKAEGRPGADAGWRLLVKTQGAAK